MSDLVLKNVSKVFNNNVTAVRDFNLEVQSGEFMVLVGPSGCGKSTTLAMIAGLEDLTSGEILIDGATVNTLPPKDRDIAMVFQNYALYPHMTVYDNMSFSLKLRHWETSKIDKRVKEAADILEMSDYLDRFPKALSGGQRQRVALGRAIVRKPKVFLFDEPLSNLDAKMRTVMRLELKKLHDRLGATMVYVTHDQTEAMTLGDHICVMNDGELQQMDTPLEIYNNPKNIFVGSFIGSPQMNLIDGRLEADSDNYEFISELFSIKIKINKNTIGDDITRDVKAGIRPEHLFRKQQGENDSKITGRIAIIEPFGSETFIYVESQQQLVARVKADNTYSASDEIELWVKPEHINLFYADSGLAIFSK
jgi:multiple sugar transport system ATP-binding protein